MGRSPVYSLTLTNAVAAPVAVLSGRVGALSGHRDGLFGNMGALLDPILVLSDHIGRLLDNIGNLSDHIGRLLGLIGGLSDDIFALLDNILFLLDPISACFASFLAVRPQWALFLSKLAAKRAILTNRPLSDHSSLIPMSTHAPRSKLRVNCFSISLDGYGAGPQQTLENPLGVGGMALHEWVFPTQAFQQMHGADTGGTTGIDNDFAVRGMAGLGAWILGRNMFGPIRGEWPDEQWKGWWGENPPYHVPVFVLTHHPRASIVMEGGTTFHFVTEGIQAALSRAREAAQGKDVRLGGGVATVRQYLEAGLIDELHLAFAPVLLGQGENLFAGLDLPKLGYQCTEHVPSPNATHVVLTKCIR